MRPGRSRARRAAQLRTQAVKRSRTNGKMMSTIGAKRSEELAEDEALSHALSDAARRVSHDEAP